VEGNSDYENIQNEREISEGSESRRFRNQKQERSRELADAEKPPVEPAAIECLKEEAHWIVDSQNGEAITHDLRYA
jgi:hypothetical protein